MKATNSRFGSKFSSFRTNTDVPGQKEISYDFHTSGKPLIKGEKLPLWIRGCIWLALISLVGCTAVFSWAVVRVVQLVAIALSNWGQ